MQQIFDARSRASVANIKALLNDLRSRGYSNDAILQAVGLSIYRSQSVEDPSRLEDAVDALCEDSRAAFHTNISRIKRKIVDALGPDAARDYIIYRHGNGLYKIDNNLISRQQ